MIIDYESWSIKYSSFQHHLDIIRVDIIVSNDEEESDLPTRPVSDTPLPAGDISHASPVITTNWEDNKGSEIGR